jgi:hypothetical protein
MGFREIGSGNRKSFSNNRFQFCAATNFRQLDFSVQNLMNIGSLSCDCERQNTMFPSADRSNIRAFLGFGACCWRSIGAKTFRLGAQIERSLLAANS